LWSGEEQCLPVSLAPTAAPDLRTASAVASLECADDAVAPGARQVTTDERDAIDPEEERELVRRAQAGDTTAFRALYERHAATVHRYAIVPLVSDRALAEDLLADTFVRAMENIERFRWQGKGVLPWLIRIAKNLCLDHLRKSGRVGAWPQGFEHLLPDPSDLSGESRTAHREVTALLRERIDECLEDINPRYRKVLHLRLVNGMARDAAAQEMEVSIGTLDVLLFRACKAFRKVYLERYGEGPLRELVTS
jgi:RNA polymerase sigma-70 factor, ECF subfamily